MQIVCMPVIFLKYLLFWFLETEDLKKQVAESKNEAHELFKETEKYVLYVFGFIQANQIGDDTVLR